MFLLHTYTVTCDIKPHADKVTAVCVPFANEEPQYSDE